MAKRSSGAEDPTTQPEAYTVDWSYPRPLWGGAVGGSCIIVARGKAEAQGKVEARLQTKGLEWKSIIVVKGCDAGLTRTGNVDRYSADLQSMVGRIHLNAAAPDTPYGYSTRDSDTTARTMWAKFMNENSHGLAISEFPRFVTCDIEGFTTLRLPHEAVKDETRWDDITALVRNQLDYWKAILRERIERLGKIIRRSAEDAEQLGRAKTMLKKLEAFNGWSYAHFVEQLLPGRKPNALDLDNRRLYKLSSGQLIPVSDLGSYTLRVDFWRRLLVLWDGPMDQRADNVRAFLNYHHRKGGKPEQFRDLVKDTLLRLGRLPGRELMVNKVEEWLQLAVQYPAELMPTDAELSQLEGMRWVLVKCVRPLPPPKPTPGKYGTDMARQQVRPGETYMEEVRLVKDEPECYQFIPASSEIACGKVERMMNNNPGLRLTAIDGSASHLLDVRNPYRTFPDGKMFAEIKGSSGAWYFVQRVEAEGAKLATRATNVDALLDHHYTGPNPAAFVEFVRGEVLRWKDARTKPPRPLSGHVDLWVIDRCERWLERASTTPNAVEQVSTFAALLGATNVEAVRAAMKDAGIEYKPAKGKGRIVAALHAACDHFSKPTPRPMDWPSMLAQFIPESTWTAKSIPEARPTYQGKQYKDAYRAVKDRLSQ